MFKLLERYMEWTFTIEPTWAGFVLALAASMFVIIILLNVTVFVITFLGYYTFLIPAGVILYALYLALFKQR